MEIISEPLFFQTCQLCDKAFTQEHPYKRHVNYCRRAQTQRKGRPKSCTSCRIAKTKCDFGQPCSRCTKKDLRCAYGRPIRNGAATSVEQCQGLNILPSVELEVVNELISCDPPSVYLELDEFASDFISSLNTISTDPSELMPTPLDVFPPSITNDMQIRVPPRSLSSKGDLTRVSNRLSSMQHASRVIMQMLYAYPQMMLRRQTFPPFIHPHWHLKTLPETLGNCMSIAQLFANRTSETQSFLWRMIAAEEARFREKLHTFSPREVHLCLEAMIIYMMMSMSEPDSESKERTSRLFETAELIGSRFLDHTGSYSTSEISEPSSTWQDWIFAESRRRMSCLWLIISCVITIENGRTCSSCSDVHNLPLPSSKLLWDARSLEEWQTEKAFFDMSCPIVTLGELVEAKANAGNPVEAQRLQSWEMGSDKMTAMLNIAVEKSKNPKDKRNAISRLEFGLEISQLPLSFMRYPITGTIPMPRMRGAAPEIFPPRDPSPPFKRKRYTNTQAAVSTNTPKRFRRSPSIISIPSSDENEDPKVPSSSQSQQQSLGSDVPNEGSTASAREIPVHPPPTSGPAVDENGLADINLVPEPTLCKEQQDLLNLIMSDKNVFFTGSAGCGKSTVLKAAVKKLRAAGKIVHITAPTGRAALGVNGTTTWSYMGWTTDTIKANLTDLKHESHRPTVKKRLMETDVLVIDEISMVENHHFQRMNECLKNGRHWSHRHKDYKPNTPPFGGVQLLVTGDFCQLPRVKPFENCMYCGARTIPDHKYPTEWNCYWNNKTKDKTLLRNNCDDRNATKLYAYKKAVQERSFERLPGHKPSIKPLTASIREKIIQNLNITMKKHEGIDILMSFGALVMLKVNLDTEKGLVNGSQGIVCGWEPHNPAKLPKFKDSTLLNIDVLAGRHAGWRARKIEKYVEKGEIKRWPIVRFHNGITHTIYPWCMVNTLGATKPYSVLYRTQLPLVLAWAVSIHKSQGMTLNRVTTDLSQAWDQALKYVALSRVTSLYGLSILEPWKKDVTREDLLEVIESTSHEVRQFLEEKIGRDLFRELEEKE
ncbi:ATP-dependent DNA helicase PIF1 [Fusarium oxysporum f. sp. rapae]|uniref:ATP-dependent DNA helicase n=1 Tax=Fusarium oxysporum f. sp. rapae TaxID=485398 RepID=A0A8J5NLF2_FUSOX|nr:ATP-dependent DNA helicase PIF1 [Fusarium oxysporum f. sp. rapae]